MRKSKTRQIDLVRSAAQKKIDPMKIVIELSDGRKVTWDKRYKALDRPLPTTVESEKLQVIDPKVFRRVLYQMLKDDVRRVNHNTKTH